MASNGKVRLSASTLGIFKNCARCFWLQFNEKVKQPRGIFPSLPGGMDRTIKSYFDTHRAVGTLPPELEGKVKGALFSDISQLEIWRNFRKGLVAEVNGATVQGAIDDLLAENGKGYSPLDYKTRGSAPRAGASEQYYGHQCDIYALLLDRNGMRPTGMAYLIYYWPKEAQMNGVVLFDTEIVALETSIERAESLIRSSVDCLEGQIPDPAQGCEYCAHHAGVAAVEKALAIPIAELPLR